MGEPAVSAFLQSVLGDLSATIRRGGTLFLDFSTELKDTEISLSRLQDLLVDGERRRVSERSVEKWMDDLKEVLYDAQDVLDEIKMERQKLEEPTGSQPNNIQVSNYNFVHAHSSSNSIRTRLCLVLAKIHQLSKENDFLRLRRGSVGSVTDWEISQARLGRETSSSVDESEIHGREEDRERIVDMLLGADGNSSKKNYDIICIVGMGGLGKTTLAQLVFQDQRVESSFNVKSWVCVSDVFDVAKTTKGLIEYVDGVCNLQTLAALHARLKGMIYEKRFLFVLDDVWTTEEWDRFKAPFNFGANGSKVLVTTRHKKVVDAISNKAPYQLGLLSFEKSLAIFKEKAFEDVDYVHEDYEDLMKLGEEIVNKCGGVPLAVKVIGAMLRGAGEERWKAILENELWHSAYESDGIHPALKLSYYYLPAFLKRCFEYFSIFPSDYTFEQELIVQMWIAGGIIDVKDGKLPDDLGRQYYNDLKERSLIQEDDKMHDIIHHLACIVSGKFFYPIKSAGNAHNSLAYVRHISFSGRLNDCENIEVLDEVNSLCTLIDFRGVGANSYQKIWSLKMLRILNFDCPFDLSELPNSIGDLKYLRYLNFQLGRLLRSLPDSICSLRNLQVLNLGSCSLLEILPTDIGCLLNLQHLNLSGTRISSLPESFCHLHRLRVLDLSNCYFLRYLPQDIGNLQSLHQLKLKYSSKPVTVPESILSAINLRILEVHTDCILPPHIGKLTNLEVLTAYPLGREQGRRISELKDMNNLRDELRIINMENIGSVEEALMADLKSKKRIKELEFVWKGEMFSVPWMGIRDGEMEVKILEALEPHRALTSFTLRGYIGHKFPSWMSSANVRNLTRIVMEDLQMMKRVVLLELPLLKDLEIRNCPILSEISMVTPKLMKLVIRQCGVLNLSSIGLMSFSSQLEDLDCDYHYLDYFLQQAVQSTSTASSKSKLKTLTVVVRDDSITCLPRAWPSIFTSLENLKLEDLPPGNFQLLHDEDHDNQTIPPPFLRTVEIFSCPRMTCTPSDLPSFTSLRRLNITLCPNLVSLELPSHLEHLGLLHCWSLRNLPDRLSSLTSLAYFNLGDCPNLVIGPHDRPPPNLVSMFIRKCRKLEWQLEMESRADWQCLRR